MRSIGGEGCPLQSIVDNIPHDRLKVPKYVARGNAQRRNTMVGKESVSRFILFRLVPAIMKFAIDFDAQPRCSTVKVERVRIGGVLCAELQAGGAIPEDVPQFAFGRRHFAPQLACTKNALFGFAKAWSAYGLSIRSMGRGPMNGTFMGEG
jgi:hypothetical protein